MARVSANTAFEVLKSPPLQFPSHRNRRRRAGLLAIITLCLLSIFLITAHPIIRSSPTGTSSTAKLTYNRVLRTLRKYSNKGSSGGPQSIYRSKSGAHQHENALPPLALSQNQELASLIAFLSSTAFHGNALPPDIDPTLPLDPELVLDFDITSKLSRSEIGAHVTETWETHPVVIFLKAHSPISRELKSLIASYRIHPDPSIFEVDERSDAAVLEPIIYRLTSSTELPVLVIGGETIVDIQAMHVDGRLQDKIRLAGGIVGGAKKKKSKGRR